MRLAVHQFAPRFGDIESNARTIAAAAREAAADLLLTPELSLSAYDIRDRAPALAVRVRRQREARRRTLVQAEPGAQAAIEALADAGDVIVGAPELARDGLLYNAAFHLRRGCLVHRHRKVYLPTYGMFDEGRYFAGGRRVRLYSPRPGWHSGILICEDFWHPGLAYVHAAAGADLLLVPAAAPGRGLDPQRSGFVSVETWERIARTTAQVYGVYVALANRTGVEDGVTFAGESLIVGPTGEVLARAPWQDDALLCVELDRREIERARRPYAHRRDDELALVAQELARLQARP